MKNVYTFDNLKWDYESLLEFKKEFNPDFDATSKLPMLNWMVSQVDLNELDPTPLTHERILALGFVESCKLPGAAKYNIGNRLINLFFDGTLAKISELNYNTVRTVGQLVKVLNLFRIPYGNGTFKRIAE